MPGDPMVRHPCLLCSGTNAQLYLSDPNGGQLVRCPRDGFVFRDPQPSNEEQQSSFKSYVPNIHMFVKGRRPALAAYAHAVQKWKPAGTLVDVGCSVGTFFEFFPHNHWQCLGIDPSDFNAREAHRLHGVRTYCGTLRDAALPHDSVDVLTLLDTFPLIPDPRLELRESRRVLKIGGILSIEIEGWLYWTICSHSPLCWLLNRSLVKLHPRQLHYFSNKNIVALLNSEGFRIVDRVLGPASTGDSPLQSNVIRIHAKLSQLLYTASARHISLAARELVIAERTS